MATQHQVPQVHHQMGGTVQKACRDNVALHGMKIEYHIHASYEPKKVGFFSSFFYLMLILCVKNKRGELFCRNNMGVCMGCHVHRQKGRVLYIFLLANCMIETATGLLYQRDCSLLIHVSQPRRCHVNWIVNSGVLDSCTLTSTKLSVCTHHTMPTCQVQWTQTYAFYGKSGYYMALSNVAGICSGAPQNWAVVRRQSKSVMCKFELC